MRWARPFVAVLCGALMMAPADASVEARTGPAWPACGRWTNTATPSARGDASYFDVEVLDPWHAYALGSRLTIENQDLIPIAARWDGWRWTPIPAPRGSTEVTDMAVVSETEIWAVGVDTVRIDGDERLRPAAWRFDGASWSQVRVPSPGRGHGVFNGVTAIPGTSQLWAVGVHYASQGGWPDRPSALAMRWSGHRWRQVEMPDLRRATTVGAVAATGRRSAWAVGTAMWPWQVDGGASLVLRFSGGRWHAVRSPDVGVLTAIAAAGAQDALALGRGYGVLRWDGEHWARIPSGRLPGSARLDPEAVTYSTAGDAWVAGNLRSATDPEDPELGIPVSYHRTSSGWVRVPVRRVGSPTRVVAIDAATPHDVWTVGNIGVFGGSILDPVDAAPVAQHWC